jgi:PAS domain S-box-containing protein
VPHRSPHVVKRTDASGLTPRSIFSYWRLTWRRLTAVFGPPLLVAIVGIVAHNRTDRIISSRADARRARAVADAADKVLFHLVNAETGQRGFLLTSNPRNLLPYERSLDSVPLALTGLHAAVDSATPTAATRLAVDSLAFFSSARMAELAKTIRLQRTRGAEAALALVKTNHGDDMMRGARRIAGSIRQQESARLASRSADITRYTNEMTWVVILGTAVAFLIALMVNVLLAREAAVQTRLAQEVQRAEHSFRALAETMPQLVWSTSASGETAYFNNRWREYIGVSDARTENRDWRDAVHPLDKSGVGDKWERAFRTGDPFDVECRLRRGSDGSYRWFLCRALPLRDETGKITQWFGTCTDVHDQRRASEGSSVLAEASAVLATSNDTDGAIRDVAQLAVPRLGDWCTIELLDPDGSLRRIATVHAEPGKLAIAEEFYQRFPATPDDPGGVYTALRSGEVQAGEVTDDMIRAAVPDPDKRDLLLALHLRSYVIAPMLIDGAAVGAITIVSAESGHFFGPSDIARVQELARRTSLAIERARLFAETVRARDSASVSNALLRESEAKLVLSMEAGGLGPWEWDIAHQRVVWSPQTERMHGLAEGTFSGTREEFLSSIHPEDRERVEGEIARTLADRMPTYHIKYRFRRADGAVRWLEGFGRLSTNEDGEPVSLLGVSHDVTDREELLAGEQQARRDAEAANAAKAIFLTTMSHELRTPLNAVSGYVDLLEMGVRGPITDAQREDLRRIRRASQHLLSLINDILNYARLEAGSVDLHLSDITLADALAGMEVLIAPQLRAKGVTYEYRACDESLCVHADREKLDQILLNLVGNAVKFTERDGHITLSCSADDAHVRVIVEDTGRGIPRAKLQSIFDPFVQVDRHLTPERQQGVGLGLAISRDLARAMHGDISVESDAGQWATFVLTLPLTASGAASNRGSGEIGAA